MSKTTKNILMIVCGVISVIIGGFMLVNMWSWFIAVPFNIKPINFWQVIGFDLMLTYIVTLDAPKPIESDEDALNTCVYAILLPLMIWFAGFICHLFM